MLSILILTSGTRGDVEPFVALAEALRGRGFSVAVAAPASQLELVTAAGIEYRELGPNPSELLAELEHALAARPSLVARGAAVLRYLRRARSCHEELAGRALVLIGESDAVLLALPTYLLYPIARALGVPAIACPLQPLTPSPSYPSALLPALPWRSGFVNRVGHATGLSLIWLPWWRTLRRWAHGELPRARFAAAGPFREMLRRGVPFVYGLSPLVFERPMDWPAGHELGGFWLPERAAEPAGEEGKRIL